MLLIATTAEEKGLLGAEHFALHPTVPVESLVALVNMDMPVARVGLTDVIPIGIEHSSLQAVAERAVQEAGLTASPEPFPEEAFFIRSDQYPFVRAGVPAISLDNGVKLADGSDGVAKFESFLKEHYHLPSDDLSRPIDWGYAAKMARMNYRVGVIVAADPARPTWNKGDFFGERFGRGAAAR
jgi:Zn-dependent M28 family amino/carboxypeptidase